MKRTKQVVAIAIIVTISGLAQRPDANYDEAKVPKYTLPDPLVLTNGERVTSAAAWNRRRRPEILKLFETHVYGRSPGRPKGMSFEVTSSEKNALAGKATRKEVTVYFSENKSGPEMDMLI